MVQKGKMMGSNLVVKPHVLQFSHNHNTYPVLKQTEGILALIILLKDSDSVFIS